MRHYTYEPWTKQSIQAHNHATIRYANGIVSILSRDELRSVARRWDAIGTYEGSDCGPHTVRFTEDSLATSLVATHLERNGTVVKGATIDPDMGRIIRLESNGRVTNPESIQGRIRDRNPGNKRDKRTNCQKRFGTIGHADVIAMREALLKARK